MNEAVRAKRSPTLHIKALPSTMLRMVTDTSIASPTPHELTDARCNTLEAMILEERACRMKDVAEIGQTFMKDVAQICQALAELQDTVLAGLSIPNISCVFQDSGNDSIINKSQACSVCDYNAACAAPGRASDVGNDAMQEVNKLMTEMGQNFASQLQDVEARFQAQTEKQMTLLEGSLEAMEAMTRLKHQIPELNPAARPENSKETAAAKTIKAAKETSALRSHGPVLNRGQSAKNLKTHEQSNGPIIFKNSSATELRTPVLQSQNMTKELVYTPWPAHVRVASAASTPVAAWKATRHSSALAAYYRKLQEQ